MNFIEKIRSHGLVGSVRKGVDFFVQKVRPPFDQWRFRNGPHYTNPTPEELKAIEGELKALGVFIEDFSPTPHKFSEFQTANWFPPTYHGGLESGVFEEKLLEHWISGMLLGFAEYNKDDIYVDIAAGSSPWAKELREREKKNAFAIDLNHVADAYIQLPYYRVEDATQSSFADESVCGVSLHCAYEMFMDDDDVHLIDELARILKPGGKAIILPLYMHTIYCTYATPDYFGKGYSGPSAKEYVRMDCYGIPSSRKYDAVTLKNRVLDPLLRAGLKFRLLALRNKEAFGANIYCHFILEIEK